MGTPKFRIAVTLAAVCLTLFILTFGGASMTAYANQNALPGDRLYEIKTGLEQTRLSLARDAADKARLNLAFAERRLDEIARLIENGRFDDISLAVQEYEAYIQSATASLETVAAGDPASLPELIAQVADSLKRYTATLSSMVANLPDSARMELERAISLSTSAGGFSDEIEITGIVEQITASSWVVGGRTLMLTLASEIKGQIAVGEQVKVHAYQDAAGNWILREVELLLVDDSDDDGSDDSSDDSSSGKIEFTGIVEQITASSWVVGGRTLMLALASEIKGQIAVGDQVKVHAYQDAAGSWILREVELLSDDDIDDDDSDDDIDDDIDDDDIDDDDSDDDIDDDIDDDDIDDDDSGDDDIDDDDSGDDDSGDDDSGDDDSGDDDSSDDDSGDDDSGDDDSGDDDSGDDDSGDDDSSDDDSSDDDSGDDDSGDDD